MIAVPDMERMVRRYLRAARFLNRANANDPDAAIYLCGYAVEIALKVRICMVLGRVDFPETASEFRHTQMHTRLGNAIAGLRVEADNHQRSGPKR
jgi:hypothetical protein